MMDIPEDIKQKIKEAAKQFSVKEMNNEDNPCITISHNEFYLQALIGYNEGAIFGYNLSKELIEERDIRIKVLESFIAAMQPD